MKLGSSMRRRRGRTSGSTRQQKAGSGGSWAGSVLAGRGARPLVLAGAALLLGSGGGYLYATHVMFPGPETTVADFRTVPDLRDMLVDEAAASLGEAGLVLGEVDSIRHPEVEEGRILGQTPLPGQLGLPGGEVEVTMSLGPERRPVPDVSRLLAGRALTVLETTGFEVEVDSVEADLAAGRVVATVPAAGEEVTLPSSIRMTVSLGPPLVEVPDVLGMQEEQARAILEELGLEVGEIETRFRFGFNQGEVLGQTPAAGEEIPRGSVVHLEVGRRGLLRDPGGPDRP
jgi:beta-lactam-binding protein with PASTA domain